MTLPELFAALRAYYGAPHWWPADSPYEVMVGAVLTQNTNWRNVERAIANFGGDLSPERVAALDEDALIEIIRPSGFFRQKARYLRALTAWFARYDYAVEAAREQPQGVLRRELLAVPGIGPETADSILLYALGFPSFVVDAYTRRLFARLGIDAGTTYDAIKIYCLRALPPDAATYNEVHALIVLHAKTHCQKRPRCADCPLRGAGCAGMDT